MPVQAQWHDIVFETSATRVRPIVKFSTGMKLDYERHDDTEGEPATQAVRRGLQTIDISYRALASVGIWPKIEVEGWMWNLGIGMHAPFYIHGESFLDREFICTKVDMDSEIVRGDGFIIDANINITLEEYAEEASGLKIDKGFEINFTPGIQSYTQDEYNAALNTRASNNDKLLTLKSIIGGAHNVRVSDAW